MARLTPEKIQELADPVESIYQDVVDELLINIGKHLRGNTTTWTAYWEVQKLAELGQLTAENAAIINRYVENMPQTLKDTMEATRKVALSGIESQLQAAAAKGYITPPITDSSVDVYKNLMNQATDRLNATNTTMLESSVDAYQQAVHMTAQRAAELERSGEYIMEQSSAALASGTVTRTQALKETIQKLSDAGLTGFYDRSGRSWSPEAYVNMVTRTTVHNVAIESTKARMQDYGTSVIQISSHGGARPLCYPYQGKFYSWDNTSGEIELGNGRTVRYEALNSTSYGQPAGIFGINCGHYAIPVIPGVTIPHGADNIEPEEENKKNYAESQQQRALERKVREAKRVLEMEGNLATDKQKQALKEAQAASAKFAKETGRTRRYDRESLYSARSAGQKKEKLTSSKNNTKVATTESPETVKNKLIKQVQSSSWFTSLKDDDSKVLAAAFENLQPGDLKLYASIAKNMSATFYHSDSFYRPSENKVYININDVDRRDAIGLKNTTNTSSRLFFHETGHWLDSNILTGTKVRYEIADFRRKIETDAADYVNALKPSKVYRTMDNLTIEQKKAINKDIYIDLWVKDAVSDLFGGMTKNAVIGRIGHDTEYWTWTSDALEKEAFAHMWEARCDGGDKDAMMRQYFPTAYKAFNDYIDNVEAKL